MAALFVLAIALGPAVVALGPLFFWTRWLRRRTGAPSLAAWIGFSIVGLGALVALVGAAASVHSVTLAAVGESDGPSEKARRLGEGISEAFNCGALVGAVALVAALWLLSATWRWHWSVRPAVPKGEPPYR